MFQWFQDIIEKIIWAAVYYLNILLEAKHLMKLKFGPMPVIYDIQRTSKKYIKQTEVILYVINKVWNLIYYSPVLLVYHLTSNKYSFDVKKFYIKFKFYFKRKFFQTYLSLSKPIIIMDIREMNVLSKVSFLLYSCIGRIMSNCD